MFRAEQGQTACSSPAKKDLPFSVILKEKHGCTWWVAFALSTLGLPWEPSWLCMVDTTLTGSRRKGLTPATPLSSCAWGCDGCQHPYLRHQRGCRPKPATASSISSGLQLRYFPSVVFLEGKGLSPAAAADTGWLPSRNISGLQGTTVSPQRRKQGTEIMGEEGLGHSSRAPLASCPWLFKLWIRGV